MLTLTTDQFAALGRELVDMRIALHGRAVADHAQTVDVPAPTDHPLIERIVKQHGGAYAVQPAGVTPLATRLAAVETQLAVGDRVAALETRLGLSASGSADDRVAAIEKAATDMTADEAPATLD